jgi:hypothetical protein
VVLSTSTTRLLVFPFDRRHPAEVVPLDFFRNTPLRAFFPSNKTPMVVGRSMPLVRAFLKHSWLAHEFEGFAPAPAYRVSWWEVRAAGVVGVLRAEQCAYLRTFPDGEVMFEHEGGFTYYGGGVAAYVPHEQAVWWDAARHTCRRSRDGKKPTFCDPHVSGRDARRDWELDWPRVLCVDSFTALWGGTPPNPRLFRVGERLHDFFSCRRDKLARWVMRDAAPKSLKDEEDEMVIEDAERALQDAAALRGTNSTAADSLIRTHANAVRALFMRDSEPIRWLKDVVEGDDLAAVEARAELMREPQYRDEFSMRRSKQGFALQNARRRSLLRRLDRALAGAPRRRHRKLKRVSKPTSSTAPSAKRSR